MVIKILAWWLVLELYTKHRPEGLYEAWSCSNKGKLLIDWKSWIFEELQVEGD